MAGYSKVVFVGGLGGYLGADGINPIFFQILIGDASRQWLEVLYVKKNIKPLGNVTRFVPRGPDNPNMLLDACILFFPDHFRKCATLNVVKEHLTGIDFVDFDTGANVPEDWEKLREEAKEFVNELAIFKAELKQINII
jgi:hypothetical protein